MSLKPDLSARKNDDCYFYYYSTCLKGDNCLFRHEENALGCEDVCQYWKEGKCANEHCNLRHMELKKNRKSIQCYWETQPSGCRKPHCPFRHAVGVKDKPPDKPRDVSPPVVNNAGGGPRSNMVGRSGDMLMGGGVVEAATPPMPAQIHNEMSAYANPSVVDPLVVKFEEESDNESVPSLTPQKCRVSMQTAIGVGTGAADVVKVKTLEEIRLERVLKESAAFYGIDYEVIQFGEEEECRRRRRASVEEYAQMTGRRVKVVAQPRFSPEFYEESATRKRIYSDCRVLTLDEIRRNREKRFASSNEREDLKEIAKDDVVLARKQIKIVDSSKCLPDSTSETDVKDDDSTQSDVILKLHEEEFDVVGKQRPIKLQRVTSKRSYSSGVNDGCDDPSIESGGKVKQIRIMDDTVDDVHMESTNCLTDDNNSLLSVFSASDNTTASEDILRDIDAMLNN